MTDDQALAIDLKADWKIWSNLIPSVVMTSIQSCCFARCQRILDT